MMKTLLLASSLLLAPSAFAQNSPSPSQNPGGDSAPGASQQMPKQTMKQRFANANTSHDGRLTRSQAQAMPMVYKHFDEIDTSHAGYVTLEEIRAWHQKMRAMRQDQGGHPPGKGSPTQSESGDQDAN